MLERVYGATVCPITASVFWARGKMNLPGRIIGQTFGWGQFPLVGQEVTQETSPLGDRLHL